MNDAHWIVVKFGGTSLTTASAWQQVRNIARQHLELGRRPLIVCSALAGISNLLEDAYDRAVTGKEYQPVYRSIVKQHRHLCEALRLPLPAEAESLIWKLRKQLVSCGHNLEFQPACKAKVMAIGELLATVIGQAWLKQQGLELSWLDARDLLSSRSTEPSARHYLSARCDDSYDEKLSEHLAHQAPTGAITQGFIARDPQGETVLLGRGGSDTSAACLAARLGASELEIWTDVPGLFTANPRETPDARLIHALNYDQAELMAYRGAKVLHPRSLSPVRRYGIPLRVRSTHQPEFAGTLISADAPALNARVHAVLARHSLTHLVLVRDGEAVKDAALYGAIQAAFGSQQLELSSIQLSSERAIVLIDSALEMPEPEKLTAAISKLTPMLSAVSSEPASSVSLIGHNLEQETALCTELQRLASAPGHGNTRHELTVIVSREQAGPLVAALHQQLLASQPQKGFGPSWQELNRPLEAMAS